MNECCEQATAELDDRLFRAGQALVNEQARAHFAEAEVATLRETLRRVEALAESVRYSEERTTIHVAELDAALAQPAQEGQG